MSAARDAHAALALRVLCADDRWWLAARVMREAAAVGFGHDARARFGIVVAELVTNLVEHGGGGTLRIERLESPRRGLRLVAEDQGPGIADPSRALHDGFSRGRMLTPDDPWPRRRGLGAGLGAIARLMDEVRIDSVVGRGTRIEATHWLRPDVRGLRGPADDKRTG